MRGALAGIAAAGMLVVAVPAAASPRETLTVAAFQTTDKNVALAEVNQAITAANVLLAADAHSRDAQIQYAAGIGYRAKLTRNAKDAKAARHLFETLAASNPNDPEAQILLAGWHLDAIADLGPFLAGVAIGAKAATGTAALDRAVALGRGRAFFPGIAALMRIRLDNGNVAGATQAAQLALQGATPTPLDRIARRAAEQLLVPLRAGDGHAAAELAKTLLPFGRLAK
ncbi:hypothetical protein [Sphingomonas nostoxanthinifaciens]|uniref:hypothetical protein n=1 Tax=Sphingomonas nostoxanthinifaciens TaxID=2872652 RepID=UPI001CC1C7C4|nr:hypothetical protein [Sphingomonas nostoxanthinifaciens]UAK24728.1 hypothetical protein K8P63_00430 [Sphingomonas nostoxanthinifaciens]